MDELEKGYRFREPAKKTIEFMEEQIKFNQQMQLAMNDMKHDIKTICNQMAENNEQNRSEHRQIMSRLGKIERFALGTLMIFALAALYFLFRQAGLPTP